MKELTVEQVSEVSGGGAGAVGSCLIGGRMGFKVGMLFGSVGALAGTIIGCGVGVGLYYMP